jgi:hypothetical protein
MRDIFENLDDVPWDKLQHAYGSAEDVPQLLRNLVSPIETERQGAIYELFGNIWHQGTVYEATLYAVSFLIEILKSDRVSDKDEIAMLLASIAGGQGYYQVHANHHQDRTDFVKILAKKGKTIEEEIAKELQIMNAIQSKILPVMDLLIPYLNHGQSDYRSSVALAMGNQQSNKNTYLPMLEEALINEEEEEVHEDIAEAIEKLRKHR